MSVSVLIVCKPANERNMLKKFNKLHPNYYTKSKINDRGTDTAQPSPLRLDIRNLADLCSEHHLH